MQSTMAQDRYLLTEVNTAAPQKLQLMLIEAALRLANRGRQYWREGRDDRAIEAIDCARSILAEMRAAIKYEAAGELGERFSAVYEFVFRRLVSAGGLHDAKGLDDAIRVLEVERETWRQVCDNFAANAPHAAFGDAARGVPPFPNGSRDSESPSGGLFIEA